MRVPGREGAFTVRDFLTRNEIAFTYEPGQGPVQVRTPSGAGLTGPDLRALAEAVGCHVRCERDAYDLVVVGAGPAGLAAAVYATC